MTGKLPRLGNVLGKHLGLLQAHYSQRKGFHYLQNVLLKVLVGSKERMRGGKKKQTRGWFLESDGSLQIFPVNELKWKPQSLRSVVLNFWGLRPGSVGKNFPQPGRMHIYSSIWNCVCASAQLGCVCAALPGFKESCAGAAECQLGPSQDWTQPWLLPPVWGPDLVRSSGWSATGQHQAMGQGLRTTALDHCDAKLAQWGDQRLLRFTLKICIPPHSSKDLGYGSVYISTTISSLPFKICSFMLLKYQVVTFILIPWKLIIMFLRPGILLIPVSQNPGSILTFSFPFLLVVLNVTLRITLDVWTY